MIRSFRELEVYKESYKLAVEINKNLIKLPKFERFELVSQMRRASKSIPANIAEGWAKRKSVAEFKRYIKTALGSCHELEVHLEFAKDLRFWPKSFCEDLLNRYQILGCRLTRLFVNWH